MGGETRSRSAVGEGSVFELRNPPKRTAVPVGTANPDAMSPVGSTSGLETLVAADHPIERRVEKRVLRRVEIELGGRGSGLRTFVARHDWTPPPGKPHVPRLDGCHAAGRILRERDADALRVVASSVDLTAEARDGHEAIGLHDHFEKAPRVRRLQRALREPSAAEGVSRAILAAGPVWGLGLDFSL